MMYMEPNNMLTTMKLVARQGLDLAVCWSPFPSTHIPFCEFPLRQHHLMAIRWAPSVCQGLCTEGHRTPHCFGTGLLVTVPPPSSTFPFRPLLFLSTNSVQDSAEYTLCTQLLPSICSSSGPAVSKTGKAPSQSPPRTCGSQAVGFDPFQGQMSLSQGSPKIIRNIKYLYYNL